MAKEKKTGKIPAGYSSVTVRMIPEKFYKKYSEEAQRRKRYKLPNATVSDVCCEVLCNNNPIKTK